MALASIWMEDDMLRKLALENVGPAPKMKMELAERVNLVTGDNGLGKSFLLDIAWYSLTRRWPQDINSRMNSGFAARPRNRKEEAKIEFSLTGKSKPVNYTAAYSARDESWLGKAGRPWNPGLVIYAHADGSFSVWDPARNYWRTKGGVDTQERLPGFVFTEAEMWNGLYARVDNEYIPICRGLLTDWSVWLSANDENARLMQSALKALSTCQYPGGFLRPGPLMRLSVNDGRDIPSLETSYAGNVPILHASSGIRRVAALAYMLTWSWSEHNRAAEQLGEDPTHQVVMLVDEVESHLHPRWQRLILEALRDFVNEIHSNAEVQLIVSTHSPLVLASAEPWFDPEKDAWFDLDFDEATSHVELNRRDYILHGTAGNWLTSDAFDLKTDRGSIEAEDAILEGREMQSNPNADLNEIMALHARLCKVLPDLDPFWPRWIAFVENRGGKL